MRETSNKQIIRNPQLIDTIKKIKRSRIKLDVIDLSKYKRVTAKIFWTQLDFMIELNFESSSRRIEALDYGLEFGLILPGSTSPEMPMFVIFDAKGSIRAVGFDIINSVHDNFWDMLFRSKLRSNVQIECG